VRNFIKIIVPAVIIVTVIIVILMLYLNIKKSAPIAPKQVKLAQVNQLVVDQVVVIAENLDTPWGLVFLPDKNILFTERPGKVRLINTNDKLDQKPVIEIAAVKEISEGGLLGITIHPDFIHNSYVYLYYTYEGNNEKTWNKVVRMTYKNNTLSEERIIIDQIPGAPNHNGGRIKFGPDNLLYVTTGDAQNPSQAQDVESLAGKILRVTDDGQEAPGNPFNNLIYSYGHRNPQGLTWDNIGRLWSTEHGRSGALSGLDELNLIEKGANYGWPKIQGDESGNNMSTPKLHSGSETWAPAGAVFFKSSILFTGLRGQALYEAKIDVNNITLKQHFSNRFGRLRDIILGPDNMLYIMTSNLDGRGNPKPKDDKILKIDPKSISL